MNFGQKLAFNYFSRFEEEKKIKEKNDNLKIILKHYIIIKRIFFNSNSKLYI